MSGILWVSHRGYCADAIENTERAFDASIDAGFRSLETDLRCTADGHIVLHHDPSLLRTFGLATRVEQTDLNTLQNIGVLDFERFISRYAGCSWTFDIKPESGQATLKALKAWVNKRGAEDWFNHQARFLFWTARDRYLGRKLFPKLPHLASQNECYRAGLAVLGKLSLLGGIQKGKTYSLPRFFAGVDLYRPEVAKAYQRRGARILAYLPANDSDALAAVKAGFDEILTNHRPLV